MNSTDREKQRYRLTLMYATFVAGLCSIIYELLIATTTSYFLGDSVTWFSLTIGLYMAAMGTGSWLSKYMQQQVLARFIIIELMLGLAGGLSVPLLYFAYSLDQGFIAVFSLLTLLVGVLIGMEIPLLTRLMEPYRQLRINIAHVLSLDYMGALIATLAFPFVLLPLFGVYQSSLLFGLVNMSIAVVVLYVFRLPLRPALRRLQWLTLLASLLLLAMLLFSAKALKFWDSSLYQARIIYSEQSLYQHIVMTRDRDDIRLFINGNLQFSSVDEYRYHEALVHVPLGLHRQPVHRVLLLGAGDGLATRELLKYPDIERITLVDLDPAMTRLARRHPLLRQLNAHSLDDPRVHIIHQDAFVWLRQTQERFDLIISDLPDPNNISLTRLYSTQFYHLVRQHLMRDGMFVTQATSPYYATRAFWCIVRTLEATAFPVSLPYHVYVPSFGDWGFVLASNTPLAEQPRLQVKTRYLQPEMFPSLMRFAKDIQRQNVAINAMDHPVLLGYYLSGWSHYGR